MPKATKEQYEILRDRCLRGIRRAHFHADSKEAYAEAERVMSPHQLGALHRAMAEATSDCEYHDMRMGAY